jgi:hypothetical protein
MMLNQRKDLLMELNRFQEKVEKHQQEAINRKLQNKTPPKGQLVA